MAVTEFKNPLIFLVLVSVSVSHVCASEEVWSWGTVAPVDPRTPLPIQVQEASPNAAPAPASLPTAAPATAPTSGTVLDVTKGITSKDRADAARFLGSHSSLCGNGLGTNCVHGVNKSPIDTHYGVPTKDEDLVSSYTSYDSLNTSIHEPITQNIFLSSPVLPPRKQKPVRQGAVTGFIKSIGEKISTLFPLHHKKHTKPILTLPKLNYHILTSSSTAYSSIKQTTVFEPSYKVPSPASQLFTTALHTIQPSFITHIHKHTHIHQGGHFEPSATTSTVTITPVLLNVNTFAKENQLQQTTVTKTVHHLTKENILPTIVNQHSQVIISQTLVSDTSPIKQTSDSTASIIETTLSEYLPPNKNHNSVYVEQCYCMPESYCPADNIVPKTNSKEISNLLDARSRKTEILSNATEKDEGLDKFSTTTSPLDAEITEQMSFSNAAENDEDQAIDDLNTTISPLDEEITEEITTEFPSASTEETSTYDGINATRIKRSLEFTSRHSNIKLDKNGRQINGYTPGYLGCGEGHICCRQAQSSIPIAKNIQSSVCGKSKSNSLLGRVKTAHPKEGEAEFGEYPWQAAILKKGDNGTTYVCGAVLIDDRHVLTAAHCVNGLQASELLVRLGEWDFSQDSEFFRHIDFQVSQLYEHERYYKGNLNNDITILRLNIQVDFSSNPHISPVCLPVASSDFSNQLCTVTGWGKDDFSREGQFQRILQEVSVPVVGKQGCQKALRQTRLGNTFVLEESMMCAGGEEYKDACKGDGGSPLVCPSSDGSYQLAGLVSWGIGCGEEGIPGVYVDVTKYLPWITQVQRS